MKHNITKSMKLNNVFPKQFRFIVPSTTQIFIYMSPTNRFIILKIQLI